MLKTLKLQSKLIELSKDKEEIKKYSLEMYSSLLGYFSNKKDSSFTVSTFNENETLKELENRILELININYYKILGIRNNNLESFNLFIENISNDDNKELCDILNRSFYYGYNFYEYYHSKYNSIFDYIISHKHEKLEYKLKNFIKSKK